MGHPWNTVDTVQTEEGPLLLQRRGTREFVISISGRVLMSSTHTRSEVAVAELGCAPIRNRASPRVLIGGLGLGFTLRAALNVLAPTAVVTVAELTPAVVDWCRGPAAILSDDALSDPRVTVRIGDVARELRRVALDSISPRYDAVILDLYMGPPEPAGHEEDPLYGPAILRATRDALSPGGVLAVWGEIASPSYVRRMGKAGFRAQLVKPQGGGPRHAVHLGIRTG
jgi:spermidine synthase